MRHDEADIQRAIVQGLRQVLPFGSVVHACNSEVRGSSDWARKQQALAASMGVFPGFSDLIVISARKVLFLEVKTATGRPSLAQMEFAGKVESQGFHYALVRSFDDAVAALRDAQIPTRIRGFS